MLLKTPRNASFQACDLATHDCSTSEQKRRSKNIDNSLKITSIIQPGRLPRPVCLHFIPIGSGCVSVDHRDESRHKCPGETTMTACKHSTFFLARPGKIFTCWLTRDVSDGKHCQDVVLTEKVCRHKRRMEPNPPKPQRGLRGDALIRCSGMRRESHANMAASLPISTRPGGVITLYLYCYHAWNMTAEVCS